MTTLHYPSDRGMALLTAVYTPFDSDGNPALEMVEKQAEAVSSWGCPAVFIAGTAGEGASMTVDERMALTERWCSVAGADLDVIVHVGHTSLADARSLAAHAEASGARAIASVAPYFFKPSDASALVSFLAEIAAAAPGLPFSYYHIPSVTGVTIPASTVLTEAAERIPSFVGVKYADGNLVDLQRCLELAGANLEVFVGAAKLLLPAMSIGARCAIGSVYNYTAPIFLEMLDHQAAGETRAAQECQYRAQTVIDAASAYGGELAGGKALTGLVGVDCGPVRLPMVSPSDDERERLRAEVIGLGLDV